MWESLRRADMEENLAHFKNYLGSNHQNTCGAKQGFFGAFL
jgi:hypothetical protein